MFSNTVTLTVTCALALLILSQNSDEVRAILSVQWSDDDKLQKKKLTLQKVLQTSVSKSKFNGDCDVINVSEDGRAEIKIKPAAGEV